jgi:hypothetical protein
MVSGRATAVPTLLFRGHHTGYAVFFVPMHAIALLAGPFTFTWDALAVAAALYVVTGGLGLSLSYHRQVPPPRRSPACVARQFSHAVNDVAHFWALTPPVVICGRRAAIPQELPVSQVAGVQSGLLRRSGVRRRPHRVVQEP